MLIYRDAVERVRTGGFLRRCRAAARDAADQHDRTRVLIDVGMIEAALTDIAMPEADDVPERTANLRDASLAAGRLFCGSDDGQALQAALHRLERQPLPGELELRTPEGYAYYALDPRSYADAARAFDAGAVPGRVVCIGLRSIGTSLSAVVTATLAAAGRPVESLTLRPRGHPFARRPETTRALRRWLAERAGAMFLIVDEGPGQSGSSFCGTAAFLCELGVPDEQIAFFPSHRPDPASFVSAAARERWQHHAAWHVPLVACDVAGVPGSRELSGGAWRGLLYPVGTPWPAVLPWQERRKFLSPGPEPVLHKFVGLGRFGDRALARASALAAAGLTSQPSGLRDGFLAQMFVPGRPLRRNEGEGAFLRWAARHLGHLAAHAATGEPARPDALLPMARVNIEEALGLDAAAALELHAATLPPAPAVELDGRVLPHEWLRTATGFLKTDANDHHADHGFPGPADIAWDVAAVGVEFDLTPAMHREFVAAAAAAVRDQALAARLTFYEAAYLAYRTGCAAAASESLGSGPEGSRMRRALARYRALLETAAARLQAA